MQNHSNKDGCSSQVILKENAGFMGKIYLVKHNIHLEFIYQKQVKEGGQWASLGFHCLKANYEHLATDFDGPSHCSYMLQLSLPGDNANTFLKVPSCLIGALVCLPTNPT